MRDTIDALAASCRISLDEPRTATETRNSGGTVQHPDQTRTRSALAPGRRPRTYAEIAKALFISEKTVSVHISNLLRKTGTSSRREVSALALRTGLPPTTPD
ncbi:MAG: LuxR C-terminal-related transcriptional regulator [Actinomycetota bacterium]